MNEEINALQNNNTWDIVTAPKGRNIIACKWGFKTKINTKREIERFKARVVARGFSQNFGLDYDEIFAPVVR